MKFGVLGPLSMVINGCESAPTAPKQRQVLALLLLNANHVVSVAQLVEELWDQSPPSSAIAAVHTYVKDLRRLMTDAQKHTGDERERLVTREPGYLLRVLPGEVDLDLFSDEFERANLLAAQYGAKQASQLLKSALARWRAPTLSDVDAGPVLRPAIELIDQQHLAAVIQRIQTDLDLGHHHELIGELSGLAAKHAGNELVTAQLMRALYRSGRQSDALAAFHAMQQYVRREHGSAPSTQLCQLYVDIISAHPKLEQGAASPMPLSLDLADAVSRRPRSAAQSA